MSEIIGAYQKVSESIVFLLQEFQKVSKVAPVARERLENKPNPPDQRNENQPLNLTAMPYVPTTDLHLPRPVAAARRHFYEAGWSYRSAAPHLGVCYQHLCQVLRGERQSRRLIAAIADLPKRQS